MGGLVTCYTRDINSINVQNEKVTQEMRFGAYQTNSFFRKRSSQQLSLTEEKQQRDTKVFSQYAIVEEWQNYIIQQNPELEGIQNETLRVALIRGVDITLEKTHAILLEANEQLIMNSELANILISKGGSQIQDECRYITQKEGRIRIGQAIFTTAGDLPCKSLMNFIFPTNDNNNTEQYTQLLQDAYTHCLIQADQHDIRALTIPFYTQYPQSDYTNNNNNNNVKFLKIFASALNTFIQTHHKKSLMYIRLFHINTQHQHYTNINRDFEYIKHVL